MIRHYVFYEREVHPCASWDGIGKKYPGGYFYSPYDDPADKWGQLAGAGWDPLPIQQIPKEFRLQLLLLGVPM